MPIDPSNASKVGQVEEEEEEADAPGMTLDPAMAEAIGAILGTAGAREEEPKTSAKDYLGQLFGGSLYGSGASDDFRMDGFGRTGGTATTLIGEVGRMSEAELSYLQRRLFQAGFYDGTVYENGASINWGQIDTVTARALETAFEQAAMNQVDNFDQFLASEAARFRRDGVTADGSDIGKKFAGEAAERPIVDIVLEDPDAIKLTAEAVGTELLGRKPTEAELGRITQKIHAEQTRVAQERARIFDQGGGTPTDPFADTKDLLAGDMGIEADYVAEGDIRLTGEQFENARTIITVGQEMGLSEEYIVGALSAAIVESGLKNVNYGDRDSVGLFQQRTSQGWGTVQQIMDPRYSSRKFYEAMLRADGDTLGERVANTQRPAAQYRGRYGEQMNKAAGVLATLLGSPTRSHPGAPGAGTQPAVAGATQTDASRAGTGSTMRPANPRQADLAARYGRPASSVGGGTSLAGEDDSAPFWLDSMVGNSESDPIFNTVMGVDVNASIAEEMRKMDPVAYGTRQAAVKAYEFFGMLGAGGGLI